MLTALLLCAPASNAKTLDVVDKVSQTPGSQTPAARSNPQDALLLGAAYRGYTFGVQQALDSGANANARDENGRTPLIVLMKVDFVYASELTETPRMTMEDKIDVAQLLLDHKANIDAQDATGKTALMEACRGEDVDAVAFLLNKGAQVNLLNNEGATALFYAVQLDRLDSCRKLVAKGANINLKMPNGNTPLLIAVASNIDESEYGLDLIKLLLSKGANPNVKNKAGYSPLDYASQPESAKIAKLLKKYGAKL